MVVGGACVVVGGMRGSGGPCMVAEGGMHGCWGRRCMVGGHAWFLGGMRGCQGACVGYDEIR